MPNPDPLPRPLQTRPFTVGEAREHGVTRSRLRARDLAHPFHGVRVPTAAPYPDETLAPQASTSPQSVFPTDVGAFRPLLAADQFFSHLTAAEIWGLRMPAGHRQRPIDVTVVGDRRAPRHAGVSGHHVDRWPPVVQMNGFRLSDQIETWCRLGEALSVEDLVVMGDGLLARKRPVTTLGKLQTAVAQRSSQRGVARSRQALALLRENTDSAQETRLRLTLWRAGLPGPFVNAPIRNRYGALIAHGDLVYPEQRVLIEYDGAQHWQDSRQFSIDIERLDELAEEGWRIIRVDKHLLARPASVLARVSTALTRNAEHP